VEGSDRRVIHIFTQQPATSDLGVGIQFFPLTVKSWDLVTKCTKDDPTCPPTPVCAQNDIGYYCLDTCTASTSCGGGECYTGGDPGFCTNDSCDPAVYAKPEVGDRVAHNTKAGLLAAMAAHSR